MAAESTVAISDSARLSISPLNNIKPAFAKSLAYMPDGGKLPPYLICKLEYLIGGAGGIIMLVTKNGKNHIMIHEG